MSWPVRVTLTQIMETPAGLPGGRVLVSTLLTSTVSPVWVDRSLRTSNDLVSLGVIRLRLGAALVRRSFLRRPMVVRRIGSSVSIFNILPFRSKPRLDLDALYRQHAGMVARRVRRFIYADDVEEVVHEVFLKAHERRDSFRGEASPVTWLYHIATNHCLNRLRDQKRRRRSLEINKSLPWLHPQDAAGAEESLLLEQLWARLDEEQSMIAIYYFVDGMTHAEIARVTGVSRRTVGNRLDEITTLMRSRTGGKS
jgi:RNA polymerase sigma-70 factor, ECF subfamily